MVSSSRSHLSVASITLFLGGLLWIAAFWLPVFETGQREIAGYWIFLTGWMGFTIFQFAWYANLLMLVAVILMYTAPMRATLFAALALLVATQAFWFDALPETTKSIEIINRGPGFWLWYAGIFLMSIGVFFSSEADEVETITEAAGTGQWRQEEITEQMPLTEKHTKGIEEPRPGGTAPFAFPEPERTDDDVKENNVMNTRNKTVDTQPVSGVETRASKSITPIAKPIGKGNTDKPSAVSPPIDSKSKMVRTDASDNKQEVSLVEQLESVRKARKKAQEQQQKARILREARQRKQEALIADDRGETEEQLERTLPALKAILRDTLFSGNEEAGSQQLPAFLLHNDN